MAIVINGSGTVTGLAVGGLPDGTVDAGTLAVNSRGTVLQVVIAEDSSALTLSSTTYTDTSLSAVITPSSTSSKVLAMWKVQVKSTDANSGFGTQLVRGSTNVWSSTNKWQQYFAGAAENHTSTNHMYIDSPSTTSATTYKVQVASQNARTIYVNSDGEKTQLVLMEIAG